MHSASPVALVLAAPAVRAPRRRPRARPRQSTGTPPRLLRSCSRSTPPRRRVRASSLPRVRAASTTRAGAKESRPVLCQREPVGARFSGFNRRHSRVRAQKPAILRRSRSLSMRLVARAAKQLQELPWEPYQTAPNSALVMRACVADGRHYQRD